MMNQITAPALDNDASNPPHDRERLERAVVANLIHYLDQKGFKLLRVFDGEATEKTETMKDAMEVIFSVEESVVKFRKEGFKVHNVVIVLGNGHDCVSDHSVAENDEDGFAAAMDEFIDQVYDIHA